MNTFHLTVARVGENVFDGEAVSAVVPGSEGVFTVLPNHEALISELSAGEVSFESKEGKKYHVPVREDSVIEISNNQATILL